jgi:hypothetical protein
MGPRKLLALREPATDWPGASTMGYILKRAGLIEPWRRRTANPESKFPVIREFGARPFVRPRQKPSQSQLDVPIAIQRLWDLGPTGTGNLCRPKACGTGNFRPVRMPNREFAARPQKRCGAVVSRRPSVAAAADPAVADTVSSIWKIS